jgi:hypothetical protein
MPTTVVVILATMENTKEKDMTMKLQNDEAVLTLAASVTERARDLIQDGWSKGSMATGFERAESFCVHGALNLALQEVFGLVSPTVAKDVEDVSVAFMCDSAFNTNDAYKMAGHGIPMATFNDEPTRQHQEVVDAMTRAADRLLAIALPDDETAEPFEFSKWADVDTQSEQAKQFLYQSLGN